MSEEEFIKRLLEAGWDKVDALIAWLNSPFDFQEEPEEDWEGQL